MKKLNIDSLVKRVLEESLQEKADDLVTKIKSKVDEWNPNGPVTISGQDTDMHEDSTPNPEGCRKIKEMIANGGEDTLGKLQEYCGEGNNELEEAETEEGNAFTGALAKAKEDGESSFNVDGKKYSVKEAEEKWIQKTNMKKGALHKKLGIPEGDKIPKSKLNSLKKELMAKAKGDKKLSAADSTLLKQVNMALTLGKVNESKSNSVILTEDELIDMIERIVNEQEKENKVKGNIKVEKAKGTVETDRVLKADKDENDDYLKLVTKKMKIT